MDTPDISNFSSSSSHRLPTVSASEALQGLTSPRDKRISTGLPRLDDILHGKDETSQTENAQPGGLARAHLTEVYGPPGVGKTSLALQACANVLHSGDKVVWVDTSHIVVGLRLEAFLRGSQLPDGEELPSSPPMARSTDELLDNFHHFSTPTLAHLFALLAYSSPVFPPAKLSLIVIDSISSIFTAAYPRTMERNDNHKGTTNKYDAVQWAANRRWNVMGDLTSRICRLAAITNAAVLVTTQTLTKIREDLGAVLHPAISGKAWDSGVNSRIVLFRDWLPHSSNETGAVESVRDARFAGVIKAGCIHHGGLGKVVPFSIGQHGLREIRTTPRTSAANGLPIATRPPLKRKRDEIVDSQSEDDEAGPDDEFGWEGDINAPFYEDSLGDPDGV